MSTHSHAETLQRIKSALGAARQVFARFTLGAIEAEYKAGHDPVTEADKAVDAVLRQQLLREGEGWLSEESVDDPSRLEKKHVWIVDPLDGTREFVAGIPEFCVSVGLADATFTLTPKHEWDIAGGAALVASGGGFVSTLQNAALRCNNQSPLLSGLLACGPCLRDELLALVNEHLSANSGRA